jgi:hypothetical protein
VVPAASLPEFGRLADSGPAGLENIGTWKLTVILGAEPARALEQVASLPQGAVERASVEFGPVAPAEIPQLAQLVPAGLEKFFETPIDTLLEQRIGAIATVGAFAKVRAGGVSAGVFPSPAGVVRFLGACADAGVAFKATAGLHHAIRGRYPLAYGPASPQESMHGFLNLCIAAALIRSGADTADAIDALLESSGEPFQFGPDGVTWKDRMIPTNDLAELRRHFFRSFGTCSVQEPIAELRSLRLL